MTEKEQGEYFDGGPGVGGGSWQWISCTLIEHTELGSKSKAVHPCSIIK